MVSIAEEHRGFRVICNPGGLQTELGLIERDDWWIERDGEYIGCARSLEKARRQIDKILAPAHCKGKRATPVRVTPMRRIIVITAVCGAILAGSVIGGSYMVATAIHRAA